MDTRLKPGHGLAIVLVQHLTAAIAKLAGQRVLVYSSGRFEDVPSDGILLQNTQALKVRAQAP